MSLPILVLTAPDGLDDRVNAPDLGADDYLVKPVELRELLARVRAIVRRRSGSANPIVGEGTVQLDISTREAIIQGTRIALSAREFSVMHALMERPGAILSRDQLESRIYGWG